MNVKKKKGEKKTAEAKVSYNLTFTTRGNIIRKLFPIIFLNWLKQNELFRETFVSPERKKKKKHVFPPLFYYFP